MFSRWHNISVNISKILNNTINIRILSSKCHIRSFFSAAEYGIFFYFSTKTYVVGTH